MSRFVVLVALVALLAPAHAESPAQGILDEIARYDVLLAELDAEDETLAAKEQSLLGAVTAHQIDERAATEEIDRRRAAVSRGLRGAYRLQRRGFARLLFDAHSPSELRRRVYYLLSAARAQNDALAAFQSVVDTRTNAAAAAAREMRELAGLQAQRAQQRAVLHEERERRVALLRSVRGSPFLAGQYAAETALAKSDFDISVSQREGSAPDVMSDDPATGAEGFRNARGTMPWPLRGRLLLGWGPYTDRLTQETLQNLGYDIAAPPGTPFRSVFAGTVTRSAYVRGYGQVVMVQHGTYATLYAHANGLRVAQGQEVKAGDVLGLVGSTGLLDESEARLHFEVRYNGTPQDPGLWLGGG